VGPGVQEEGHGPGRRGVAAQEAVEKAVNRKAGAARVREGGGRRQAPAGGGPVTLTPILVRSPTIILNLTFNPFPTSSWREIRAHIFWTQDSSPVSSGFDP